MNGQRIVINKLLLLSLQFLLKRMPHFIRCLGFIPSSPTKSVARNNLDLNKLKKGKIEGWDEKGVKEKDGIKKRGMELKCRWKGESDFGKKKKIPSTGIEPVTFRFIFETITAERDSQLHHKGGLYLIGLFCGS